MMVPIGLRVLGWLLFLVLLYVVVKRAIKDAFRELDEEKHSDMAFRR